MLRRKGILDVIGTTAIASGISVALDAGEVGLLSASIGAVGGATQAIKALLEQQSEMKLLGRNPLHFLWLSSRLPR